MSYKEGFKRILVAVDGSDASLRASEEAAGIAEEDGAKLLALHVVPAPSFESVGELGEYYKIARREAKKWLGEVERVAQSHRVEVKVNLAGALSIVDAVIDCAEANSVDLIVIGTRGRTPSATIRVGSVASGLVEYAGCAVLVIR